MSNQLAHDIEVLAQLFKAGGWTELRVESEGVSLLLSNDLASAPLDGAQVERSAATAPVLRDQPADVAPAPQTSAPPRQSAAKINPDWVAIKAPNLGTFYRSPKPGAPPFVEVGQKVTAETEICLIEVMKLFTSVRSGLNGTVMHVVVDDAELVESGQVLLYIERD